MHYVYHEKKKKLHTDTNLRKEREKENLMKYGGESLYNF